MILNDSQIIEACVHGNLVSPLAIQNVNPASIDIRLGNHILIESVNDNHYVALDISDYSKAEPYELKPGHFVLASTLETFNIPEDLSGVFRLKSSLAREGLALCGAEFADPGWHGSVATLGLKNFRQLHPVPLWPGRRIAQLILMETAIPDRSYAETGRYNQSATAQESYDAA